MRRRRGWRHHVTVYKMLAFSMAGLLAGLRVIVLTSRANSGQPTLGQGMELETIAAVVIGGTSLGGGVGNVIRTAVGVLIIASIGTAMDLGERFSLPAAGGNWPRHHSRGAAGQPAEEPDPPELLPPRIPDSAWSGTGATMRQGILVSPERAVRGR